MDKSAWGAATALFDPLTFLPNTIVDSRSCHSSVSKNATNCAIAIVQRIFLFVLDNLSHDG
jgi:hypothetical protein